MSEKNIEIDNLKQENEKLKKQLAEYDECYNGECFDTGKAYHIAKKRAEEFFKGGREDD